MDRLAIQKWCCCSALIHSTITKNVTGSERLCLIVMSDSNPCLQCVLLLCTAIALGAMLWLHERPFGEAIMGTDLEDCATLHT